MSTGWLKTFWLRILEYLTNLWNTTTEAGTVYDLNDMYKPIFSSLPASFTEESSSVTLIDKCQSIILVCQVTHLSVKQKIYVINASQ